MNYCLIAQQKRVHAAAGTLFKSFDLNARIGTAGMSCHCWTVEGVSEI